MVSGGCAGVGQQHAADWQGRLSSLQEVFAVSRDFIQFILSNIIGNVRTINMCD